MWAYWTTCKYFRPAEQVFLLILWTQVPKSGSITYPAIDRARCGQCATSLSWQKVLESHHKSVILIVILIALVHRSASSMSDSKCHGVHGQYMHSVRRLTSSSVNRSPMVMSSSFNLLFTKTYTGKPGIGHKWIEGQLHQFQYSNECTVKLWTHLAGNHMQGQDEVIIFLHWSSHTMNVYSDIFSSLFYLVLALSC